jgi:flagellar protein FliS
MSAYAASPDAYRQSAVLTATPGQLVVMLYDGARRFMRQAISAMQEGDVEQTHLRLRRAEEIIRSLDSHLDFSQGEVAENLHALYGFFLRHLGRGRVERDPAKLEDVFRLMGELREAWASIAHAI